MTINHSTTIRDGIANLVVDAIDVSGPGYLEFQLTLGGTEVATVTFAATAFGASSGGTATAGAIVEDSSATGNASPVANFQIFNGAAAVILGGTVAVAGGDINLSSLTIGATDTVSMSSLTYTAPA